MGDLVLEPSIRERLERVVLEQRQQDRLRDKGFHPLRKVLLVGPPGTGKTLSAAALAGELSLPLFTIRLDGLITLIFDAMNSTAGVYFFDEVDALAGERSRDNDVGEIRRVLNSFLQFLEQEDPDGLLVAATNHPQLLDAAMFRRFDAVIEYERPSADLARSVIKNRLSTVKVGRMDWKKVDAAAAGLSHAELTLASESAAKEAILSGAETVTDSLLVSALNDRRTRQAARG